MGGGTDIGWFYRVHGGAVVSTAIDKYITVTVGARERGCEEASNPIVRECLGKLGIDGGVSIEIESDVGERGTGLGSSSALTVGLLNALHAYRGDRAPAEWTPRSYNGSRRWLLFMSYDRVYEAIDREYEKLARHT